MKKKDGLVVAYTLFGEELGSLAGRLTAAVMGFDAAFKAAFEAAMSSCVEELEELGYGPALPAEEDPVSEDDDEYESLSAAFQAAMNEDEEK